ncbi:uncharacterized protein LOC133519986 [Cydia pomonella]|uniref:uncharacterized protein LOC133519986 n=1 Tax=Cydia pomonella TaxID=82600 RepID=UPI002ADE01EC|nr:uncharacterized protein LOC133519986 [Cydia pomonella]
MDSQNLDVSYEPMDVDLSSNTIKNMDDTHSEPEDRKTISRSSSPITFFTTLIKQEPVMENMNPVSVCDSEAKGFQNVKKYHIIMQPKKTIGSCLLVKLSVLFVLFACALVYQNTFTCCEGLDTTNMKEILSRQLYGQKRAIELISRSLDARVNSKILFLYGGTGVGKTYATTLMFEEVWNMTNVYHYLMPSFMETFPDDLLLGMSFCKSSILIVDDLSRNDFHIKEHIKNVIDKSEYLKKNITVILIYNYDNIEKNLMKNSNAAFFEFELREAFSDIDAYKEFIKFEPLTEDHLKLCITYELGYHNVANMEQIVKNFNVTLDGCKGVHTKMKLLNVF